MCSRLAAQIGRSRGLGLASGYNGVRGRSKPARWRGFVLFEAALRAALLFFWNYGVVVESWLRLGFLQPLHPAAVSSPGGLRTPAHQR